MRERANGSVESVLRRLEEGYAPGATLPSDRTLATLLGVDRRTVARAIASLVALGRLDVEGRRRTVRAEPAPRAVGLCLDSPVNRHDVNNQPSSGRLLLGRGMTLRLADAGRTMVWTEGLNPDPYDVVPTPAALAERGVHGVAVWPIVPADEATVAALRALRRAMPLVLLDRRVPGFESDFVGFDDLAAGRTIAEHGLALGHRRFAFYGWAVPETVHHRLRGVETALMDGGAPLDSSRTVLVRDDFEVGPRLAALLEGPEPPDAVVCANDFSAIALLSWLRERGVSVPGDVAVLAIGSSYESVHEPLGLTTVAFSHESAGREAADLLLARLENALDPREVVERRVPGRLVVRRSCGASSHSAVSS